MTDRYRCLDYTFQVTADRHEHLRAIRRVLENFQSDDAPAVHYHLSDRGTGAPVQFALELDGDRARISSEPSSLLDYLIWHINDQSAGRDERHVIVHAGAVVSPSGEGLLLPASSGSGKTTTTLGLLSAGFGYLSDEFALVDPRTMLVQPFPRPLALKPGTLSIRPALEQRAVMQPGPSVTAFVPATEIRQGALAGPVPVRWIVFPRYEPGAMTRLEPLQPAKALVRLVENTFHFVRRHREALPALRHIAMHATAYQLHTGDLDESVELITELTTTDAAVVNG